MKRSVKNMVESVDRSKKVNPKDLSADQDLAIALMNLVAIEDFVPDSEIGRMVGAVHEKLMAPMLAKIKDDKAACSVARMALGEFAQQMKNADVALKKNDRRNAYSMYDKAYEAYVLYLATIYGIEV